MEDSDEYPIKIIRGASFIREITYTDEDKVPINLSNCHAELQVRESALSTTPLLSISDEEGSITFVDAAGQIIINVLPEDTAVLELIECAVYDLKLTTAEGEVLRLLRGPVKIVPLISQDEESL